MFEKIIELGIYFDFYGKLLSERQYIVIELYYIHDLSLSEIGEQLDISRQGVFDILKRAEEHLYIYEEKLGLIDKFNRNQKKMKLILDYIQKIKIEADKLDDEIITGYIDKINTIDLDF